MSKMMESSGASISIDIGGTFTDCYLGLNGRASWGKASTTPDDFSRGFQNALAEACLGLDIEVPELLADVARAMEADTAGMDSLNAGQAAVDEMKALSKRIGLSQRLRDLGVAVDTLKECSELSLSDGSIIYNPKIVMDAEEVFAVYEEAY